MTDRRRNLFVLLLVAGLLVASLAVIATKPTRLGLDLKGGVSLIYQAKPTKQSAVTGDAIDRSLDIMRKRVDQIGVAEPSLQRSGADQIDVSLPDVKNADEAASQVGTTAQMWFYDWEGSVLGPNCKPDPQNANVTGGQAAGDAQHPAGAVALRRRHARREVPADQHGQGVVGRQVLSGRQGAQEGPGRARREPVRPAEGGAQQEDPVRRQADRQGPAGHGDRPRRAARSQGQAAAGLVRARRSADPRRHGHQEPRAGLRQRARRERPAQRHLRLHEPRLRACGRSSRASSPSAARSSRSAPRATPSNQHFAITLDNELISVPQIDWHQYPDGLGGGQGSRISGGFTIQLRAAAGQPAQDRRPADQARAHLRLAGLGHAGQAGARTRA